MEIETNCQSCGMPLDIPKVRGTEKDGSQSNAYCRYCYQNGTFTNPGMTIKEMTSNIITQMEKMNFDSKTIDVAVSHLPNLKRWKSHPSLKSN